MTVEKQHQWNKLASLMLLGGTIVATVINYFVNQGFWSPTLSRSGLIALVLLQPLFLVQVYYIYKGKRWAKIIYIFFTLLGLVFFAVDYKPVLAKAFTSPVAAINFMAQQVLALIVTAMLILTLRRPTPAPAQEM